MGDSRQVEGGSVGLWVSSLTNQNPEVRSTKKILMELNPTVFAYLERKR